MDRDQKRPLRVDVERCDVRRTEDGLGIELTVRNLDSRPVFVTVAVRQIQFDAATGKLDVWFSDHGRDVDAQRGRCGVSSIPETGTLDPGQIITFTARLLPTYTRVVPHEDQSFHFESVEIQEARTVVTHIGVADTPFYFNPRRGSVVSQLVKWGEERRATSALPPREAEAK